MLNCQIAPNARTTSPDGSSECGYTKATSDTCTSFRKTIKYQTFIMFIAVGEQFSCSYSKRPRDNQLKCSYKLLYFHLWSVCVVEILKIIRNIPPYTQIKRSYTLKSVFVRFNHM